jgi:hypothetical protein
METDQETAREQTGYQKNIYRLSDHKYQKRTSQESGTSYTKAGYRKMRVKITRYLQAAQMKPGETKIFREDIAERLIREKKAEFIGWAE